MCSVACKIVPPLSSPKQDMVGGDRRHNFNWSLVRIWNYYFSLSQKNSFYLAKTRFSYSISEGLQIPDIKKYLLVLFSHFSVYFLSMFLCAFMISYFCFRIIICAVCTIRGIQSWIHCTHFSVLYSVKLKKLNMGDKSVLGPLVLGAAITGS